MMKSATRAKRVHTLMPFTAWVDPAVGESIKERMRRISERNRRWTISRIAEEAILEYLPKLEERIGPMYDLPPRAKSGRA